MEMHRVNEAWVRAMVKWNPACKEFERARAEFKSASIERVSAQAELDRAYNTWESSTEFQETWETECPDCPWDDEKKCMNFPKEKK